MTDKDRAIAAMPWMPDKEGPISICGIHSKPEPNCPRCQTDIRDVIPDYDQKLAEAKAAGEHTCRCGFVYYKTIAFCPLCETPR